MLLFSLTSTDIFFISTSHVIMQTRINFTFSGIYQLELASSQLRWSERNNPKMLHRFGFSQLFSYDPNTL